MSAPAPAPLSSIEALARLVGFDTISRNANLALAASGAGYPDACGVGFRLGDNPTGDKENLLAAIGPAVTGGIAQSGYVGTAPVNRRARSGDRVGPRRPIDRLAR